MTHNGKDCVLEIHRRGHALILFRRMHAILCYTLPHRSVVCTHLRLFAHHSSWLSANTLSCSISKTLILFSNVFINYTLVYIVTNIIYICFSYSHYTNKILFSDICYTLHKPVAGLWPKKKQIIIYWCMKSKIIPLFQRNLKSNLRGFFLQSWNMQQTFFK